MEKQFEVVTVETPEVICDGGAGALGHPRVYLRILREEGRIGCPYCSRLFVMNSHTHAA